MKENLRIALISLSALENMALKDLGREIPYVRVDSFGSFAAFLPFASDFRRFAVSADEFVAHFDFFMPRRKHTLVVCRDSRQAVGEILPNTIFPNMDETEIEASFSALVEREESASATAEISQRERDIIREVASGYTNKEIADRLNISVNTVTTHRKNISSKLGIRSASGLSLYAMMNGLL